VICDFKNRHGHCGHAGSSSILTVWSDLCRRQQFDENQKKEVHGISSMHPFFSFL